jgi:hypothetical protein
MSSQVLRLICEDSLAQIHRLEAIKIESSPLTTADISKEEWTMNTRHKTGTRQAIQGHFKGRLKSGIPFQLQGGEQMATFKAFWSYATEVECIYGPVVCESFRVMACDLPDKAMDIMRFGREDKGEESDVRHRFHAGTKDASSSLPFVRFFVRVRVRDQSQGRYPMVGRLFQKGQGRIPMGPVCRGEQKRG